MKSSVFIFLWCSQLSLSTNMIERMGGLKLPHLRILSLGRNKIKKIDCADLGKSLEEVRRVYIAEQALYIWTIICFTAVDVVQWSLLSRWCNAAYKTEKVVSSYSHCMILRHNLFLAMISYILHVSCVGILPTITLRAGAKLTNWFVTTCPQGTLSAPTSYW